MYFNDASIYFVLFCSLNYLAGTLLMYLTEREAFWTLVFLMKREGCVLRSFYFEEKVEHQTNLEVCSQGLGSEGERTGKRCKHWNQYGL